MPASTLEGILGKTGLPPSILRGAGVMVGGSNRPVSLVPPEIETAAHRGWRIHPLRPKGKLPHLKEWQHRASSKLDQIEAWARQFPGCNWGAVCGPVSGFFAVDVDDPAAMQKLEDEHGPIPEGLCTVTSRGFQLLYAWPENVDVRPATNCPCDGIDVRGRDSYVVIPPSVHPSRHVYRYSDDSLPIPVCPVWLLALILNRSQAGVSARQSATAAGAVEGERTIPKGKGDPAKLSLAATLLRKHQPFDVILAAVVALDKKCEHQRGEDECRRKVAEWEKRYSQGKLLTEDKCASTEPDLITLSDVEARSVDWLWQPRIALGMINEIVGEPGVGKTTLALNLAADGSRGRLPGGGTIAPFDTIYMTYENPLAEVLRPKFDAMGGDARRLHVLLGTRVDLDGETHKGSITLSDVDQLGKAIRKTGAKLLVVDPVQSFFGTDVDWNHANKTRPILDSLGKLADETRLAILLLRHGTKGTGGRATAKGLGSIDQTGAARSSLLAGVLPDDEKVHVLLHIKSNIGPRAQGLGYAIDAQGRFSWTGASSITAAQILAGPEAPDRKLAEAVQWLSERLKAGSVEQREIRQQAEDEGISYRTLQRAKVALRICSRKTTFGGGWLWWLPTTEPENVAGQCGDGHDEAT